MGHIGVPLCTADFMRAHDLDQGMILFERNTELGDNLVDPPVQPDFALIEDIEQFTQILLFELSPNDGSGFRGFRAYREPAFKNLLLFVDQENEGAVKAKSRPGGDSYQDYMECYPLAQSPLQGAADLVENRKLGEAVLQ
jgi:hypothetical protein